MPDMSDAKFSGVVLLVNRMHKGVPSNLSHLLRFHSLGRTDANWCAQSREATRQHIRPLA